MSILFQLNILELLRITSFQSKTTLNSKIMIVYIYPTHFLMNKENKHTCKKKNEISFCCKKKGEKYQSVQCAAIAFIVCENRSN